MTKISPQALLLLCSVLLARLCRTHGATTTPNKVVEMEALRIVAKHDEEGNYTFESYDAEELFQRANAELDAGRCPEAVPLYDRFTRSSRPVTTRRRPLQRRACAWPSSATAKPRSLHFEALSSSCPTLRT